MIGLSVGGRETHLPHFSPWTLLPLPDPPPYNNRQKYICRDFPRGPVVENSLSNAGDTSSIPGQGTKIPHAAEQLS